ncbi:MAG: VanZ family protein [Limnochordales bacterium]|nr:VanZ family protein [Limnochordales bacterium]
MEDFGKTNPQEVSYFTWLTQIGPYLVWPYSLALLVLAVIRPIGAEVEVGELTIKLHHVAAFIVHVVLAGWWTGRSGPEDRGVRPGVWRRIRQAVVFSALFGVLVEVAQIPLPYRSGQAADLISDFLGIAGGVPVLWIWLRRPRNQPGRA